MYGNKILIGNWVEDRAKQELESRYISVETKKKRKENMRQTRFVGKQMERGKWFRERLNLYRDLYMKNDSEVTKQCSRKQVQEGGNEEIKIYIEDDEHFNMRRKNGRRASFGLTAASQDFKKLDKILVFQDDRVL
eukprot:snap_masked-scaffold_3-processed-gene-20.27-mRNA-1 protein AED:1.00 eAED:1.00 QI:0/-1/0/0/-1/1/1/0/134